MREFEDNYREEIKELVDQFEAMRCGQSVHLEEPDFEELADYFEDSGKSEKAMEVLDYAVQRFPFSAVFLVHKAALLSDMLKPDESMLLLEKAEAMDSGDSDIYFLKADIFVSKGMHQQAIDALSKASEICPPEELADVYMNMADIYEDWEKFNEVIFWLTKTLELNPAHEEALNRMWFCVKILESYEESILFHEKFIDANPYCYMAWHNLANAYAGKGDLEKAMSAFDFVFAINDEYEYAHRDCGHLHYRLGSYQKAADHLLLALGLSKPYKELYFTLGLCYEHLNHYSRARYFLRKAVNLDPNFSEAFFKTGDCYKAEFNWQHALISYQRAVKQNEENHEYHAALAQTYYQVDEMNHAMEAYKKAIRLKPDMMIYRIELSKYEFENGDVDEAMLTIDKGEDACGKNSCFDYLRSAFLFSTGKRKQAEEFLERGLIADYNGHILMYEIVNHLENDQEITRIIEQYKS